MTVSHPNQRFARCQWLLVFCLSSGAFAQTLDGGEVVFDRAVASVEGRVITESQLDFEARVLLINAGGVEAAFAPLDRKVLSQSLELMIDQRLAVLEADKLESFTLESGELERAVANFHDRFGDEKRYRAFLAAHEADVEDAAQVLKRSLRAQKALDGKLRLKAAVSEAEARRHQSEHPELKALPLEAVRQRLFVERFTQLVRAELKLSRRKADVRLLGPYEPGAPAE